VGVLIVFAMGLSLAASQWVTLTLAFLPIFISASVFVALGVVLIRCYHDEIKKKSMNITKIISGSFSYLLAAGNFFLPIIAAYLVLWMLLGVFFVLQDIPVLGVFFSIVFAFGPFLLLLGAMLLSIFSAFMVFIVSPIAALQSISGYRLMQHAYTKLTMHPVMQVIVCVIGLIPVMVVSLLLWLSASLTAVMYTIPDSDIVMVLQWFFIMIPFAALLSPSVVFFFNMAAEAHILLRKKH
jgi:hypothetical protein